MIFYISLGVVFLGSDFWFQRSQEFKLTQVTKLASKKKQKELGLGGDQNFFFFFFSFNVVEGLEVSIQFSYVYFS